MENTEGEREAGTREIIGKSLSPLRVVFDYKHTQLICGAAKPTERLNLRSISLVSYLKLTKNVNTLEYTWRLPYFVLFCTKIGFVILRVTRAAAASRPPLGSE